MSTTDITRFLHTPRRHYSGVRMQQGRVILDSDFNEEGRFDDEEQRQGLLHVIGPRGSSDDGFRLDLAAGDPLPAVPVTLDGESVEALDFGILPGTFFLGGMRFVLEERERFVFQRDFLQMRAEDVVEDPTGTRRFLAYLCGWEQDVSSIEDGEALEKALGGPDTSTRVRRMRRVLLREVDATGDVDCRRAFAEVLADLAADNASYDPDTCELRSEGRLRIDFAGDAGTDPCAPCSPTDGGRYLGAENQAIRIMLTSEDTFVWAFDNSAPLYRVRLDGDTVTMLTPPKDDAHRPVQNTVVELLPWSAVLDNGEKVADEIGYFARVSGAADPPETSFTIAPGGSVFDEAVTRWDAAHPEIDALEPAGRPQYAFMRIWHQLEDSGDDLEISTSLGAPLGRTGLVPVFVDAGRRGDWWTVAARPTEPQQLVPWELRRDEGAPPHGPRKHYAPLGVFTWSGDTVSAFDDCRPRFRPLTEQSRCCTVTVGDGVHSRGDYTSVQEAVDALPARGGTVCVLPGRHWGVFSIEGKEDVTVHGCGRHSVLVTPDGSIADALAHVTGSDRVVLRDLAIETAGQTAVRFGQPGTEGGVCRDCEARDLVIRCDPRRARPSGAGVEVHDGDRIRVRRCDVSLDGSRSPNAGIFVQGTDLEVRDCRVITDQGEPVPDDLADFYGVTDASFAWGGIQVGGDSHRVRVESNRVHGGLGHGITLGSVQWVEVKRPWIWVWLGPGWGYIPFDDPCPDVVPTPGGVIVIDGVDYYPVSAGDLTDVTIVDNRVEAMATNGISVLSVVVPSSPGGIVVGEDPEFEIISVEGLRIERNLIQGNLRRPSDAITLRSPSGDEDLPTDGDALVPDLVHGGIVLGEVRRGSIDANVVELNGATHVIPICGLFVAIADHLRIADNRITDNGVIRAESRAVQSGVRGGIVIWSGGPSAPETELVRRYHPATGEELGLAAVAVGRPRETGSAVRIHGNTVEQPQGRSLWVTALGPISVEGNHLATSGNDDPGLSPFVGKDIQILNFGPPWESDTGLDGFLTGLGGATLFNDNQVVLDWRGKATSLLALLGLAIASDDDVTMNGNQIAAAMPSGTSFSLFGSLFYRAYVYARSITATNNRISEGAGDALMSLVTQAVNMNTTAHNNATHCIAAVSSMGLLVDEPNLVLVSRECARWADLISGAGKNRSTIYEGT